MAASLAASIASAASARVKDPIVVPHIRPGLASDASAPPADPPRKGLLQQLFKKPAAPSAPSRFAAADQAALANISAYFNSFQTMEGQFIQFGPQGQQSEGKFYISRPGRVRFHYTPPAQLDMIADGRNLAIRNNKLNTQDIYPLSKTPLRYLLASHVDLTSDKLVSQVRREPDLIAVVINDKSPFGRFRLTLLFDAKTYEFKQFIVGNDQGNTSTAIYNAVTGNKADPGLFKINYPGMP
jgi:outer membrane lipoprotein-sorting protein